MRTDWGCIIGLAGVVAFFGLVAYIIQQLLTKF